MSNSKLHSFTQSKRPSTNEDIKGFLQNKRFVRKGMNQSKFAGGFKKSEYQKRNSLIDFVEQK